MCILNIELFKKVSTFREYNTVHDSDCVNINSSYLKLTILVKIQNEKKMKVSTCGVRGFGDSFITDNLRKKNKTKHKLKKRNKKGRFARCPHSVQITENKQKKTRKII
jgi:hypothetical protein